MPALPTPALASTSFAPTPATAASSRASQVAAHLSRAPPHPAISAAPMSVTRINAPDLPSAPIYNHVVAVPATAKLLYLSGQVPNVPETGALVEGGIKPSTAQCIRNLARALAAAGSSLEHLVKVNIFLKNMADFDAVNEVYVDLIPNTGAGMPARTCVQAGKRMSLPVSPRP